MRRLLILNLLVMAIFTAIVVSVVTLAQRLPPSQNVQAWHLTDCMLPCFAGVTLDQSTIDDAKREIDKTFGPSGYFLEEPDVGDNEVALSWRKTKTASGLGSNINMTFHPAIVSTIGLGAYGEDAVPLTLGDLVSVLGTPSCALADNSMAWLNVLYFDQKYALSFSVNSLSLNEPVRNITILPPTNSTCQGITAARWRGFSRISDYRR